MNTLRIEDEMWPHFGPLLEDLHAEHGPKVLIAGGYGIFLKQSLLADSPDAPLLVPLRQWRDNTPRVTKDLDLVISLDLIADEEANARILAALRHHGYAVSQRNPRWQFVKQLSETRQIIVELHSQVPSPGKGRLDSDRIRVKRKPSLGDRGIHARKNPEAVGSELEPGRLYLPEVELHVPNPVTWLIMKLTAADDRQKQSLDTGKTEEFRSFSRAQAVKHAQDAGKLVAMLTREESDAIPGIAAALRETPEFRKAAAIVAESFAAGQWGAEILLETWRPEHSTLIRDALLRWFGPL